MGLPTQERWSVEEIAKRWNASVEFVQEQIWQKRLQSVPRGFLAFDKSGTGKPHSIKLFTKTYVEWRALQAFESRYNLTSKSSTTVHLPPSPYLSENLRIAVEVYQALYVSSDVKPKSGHRNMMTKYLKAQHPHLSKSAVDHIVSVVNPNQKGGAPPTE